VEVGNRDPRPLLNQDHDRSLTSYEESERARCMEAYLRDHLGGGHAKDGKSTRKITKKDRKTPVEFATCRIG